MVINLTNKTCRIAKNQLVLSSTQGNTLPFVIHSKRRKESKMKRVQPIREISKINEIKTILRSKSERNFIMFCIGIHTGLRISDILQLKVKDLKNQEYIRIWEKKTHKARFA